MPVHGPGCILLDVRMPGISGLDLQARLSQQKLDLPIIIVTASDDAQDVVRGLGAGADDYVTKPFGVGELAARMRVALRHTARGAAQDGARTLKLGDIEVDLERRLVRADGREVRYVVSGTKVVDQSETRVIANGSETRLTLITCFPFDALRAGGRGRYVVNALRSPSEESPSAHQMASLLLD